MSFRLNQTSIVNLFTGEQLYSKPAVAARELIQNALDACSARSLLESTAYQPEINVLTTVDADSRIWLEVHDQGIGMDEHVLNDHFLTLGSSYYGTPEFKRLISQTANQDFVPISRFGIGILSVFMIGDIVSVTTKHSHSPRHDSVCRSLRIVGRAALAFVTEDGTGQDGTVVRVRLRAEFATEEWLRQLANYLTQTVVRPKWNIIVKLSEEHFKIAAKPYFKLRDDSDKRLAERQLLSPA